MKNFKQRVYEIIEIGEDNDKISKFYDIFLIVLIVISLLPLMFKEENILLNIIDRVCVSIFIIDYILRFITTNIKYKNSKLAYLKYPFRFSSLIDLLSIIPSFNLVNNSLSFLKTLKLFRFFRCLRVFKALKFFKSFSVLTNVLNEKKEALITILSIALIYILFTALIMFNVEPDSFDSFFDAIYWSVTALTTVGYGDIYPVTTNGRIVSMISSLCGIALVALPAGVITAGFMDELDGKRKKDDKKENSD